MTVGAEHVTRVTQAHIEARTDAITGAATRVFAEKGFARATMQDIATEAGLSAGAIYRYFRSKEEIIEAMGEETVRRNAVVQEIRGQGGTIEVLNGLADLFFAHLKEPDTFLGECVDLELWAEARRNPRVRESLQRGFNALFHQFTGIIRDAQARGDINPALDAESVARVMMASFEGLVVQLATGHDVDVPRYVEALKAMTAGFFWTGRNYKAGAR
jgi:AcrR family transcriptional regulator